MAEKRRNRTDGYYGKGIKQLRLSKGMTQRQVAAAAGVSKQSIRLWDRGAGRPTIDNATRLADALGIDVATLITYWSESDAARP